MKLLVICFAFLCGHSPAAERPNIVWILVDDMC